MLAERVRLAVVAALEGVGREDTVDVEKAPSPVECSPNGAVYLFLTDEKTDGPHVLITDADDLDEGPGFFVGAYFEQDEPMENATACPTLTAAAGTAARMVGELAGIAG